MIPLGEIFYEAIRELDILNFDIYNETYKIGGKCNIKK